jgi:Cdc6-like AAA superfamily ATPase
MSDLPSSRHEQQSLRKTRPTADQAASSDVVQLTETLLEEAPHVGREAEYEAVVSYVARRWSHDTNTALFVCGGCGCGKTSTVKRALRAVSGRVLPCDATGRNVVKRSTMEERGWRSAGLTTTDAKNCCERTNTLAGGVVTPRTSRPPSSEIAGLTPSSSSVPSTSFHEAALSSSSCSIVASAATTAAAEAAESVTSTPATTRRGSQALGEAVPFSPTAASSPASGRPSASSEDSTASALAAAGPVTRHTHKRPRAQQEEDEDMEATCKCTRGGRRAATRSSAETAVQPYSLEYFQARYPEIFSGATKSTSSASRKLFGHYVNCADLSGPLLVEAICESIQATCTRTDASSLALLQELSHINSKTGGASSRSTGAGGSHALSQQPLSARVSMKPSLHVVALDEVEYVRGGGAKTLAQLAEVAFQTPGQLAFIFISNQRAFVHVPQMMLEALLFEPYSEEQLRRIGADAANAELHRRELLTRSGGGTRQQSRCTPSSAAKRQEAAKAAAAPRVLASDIDIKSRLYDYIARKALLEYSGDVRQVIAMCHRVVSVAWEEVAEAKAQAALSAADSLTVSTGKASSSLGRRTASRNRTTLLTGATDAAKAATVLASSDLPAKLEAALEEYHAANARTQGSDRSSAISSGGNGGSCEDSGHGAGSTSASSSARSSAALPAAVAPTVTASSSSSATTSTSTPSPSSSSGVMTLAKSVRLLQSNQVESDIDRYVGTLPEQTLYVLSCIVVLTLRRQEERTYAMTSVGGRMGTSRAPGAGVAAAQRTPPTLSLKLHEVHQLYTRLMSELHFPAMRADGFPLQVECLADFGVLTRPQLRGTDRVFSLNGTWTLQAMQQALVKRGEAIKQDRITAGAEAVIENKFEVVLHELARLMRC